VTKEKMLQTRRRAGGEGGEPRGKRPCQNVRKKVRTWKIGKTTKVREESNWEHIAQRKKKEKYSYKKREIYGENL